MNQPDVIVVGSGLAGLACAFELTEQGRRVLVLEGAPYAGGRTSNWNENGMVVESGFHKFIGYYEALPRLLERAGIDVDAMLTWEKTFEIRVPDADGETAGEFGIAPAKAPIKTITGLLGNNDVISFPDKLSLLPFFTFGLKELKDNPSGLDQYSVAEFAEKYGVKKEALEHLLVPLTGGILFLPPERFSALAFFSFLAPGVPKFLKMQIGGFNGGMRDVMIEPLVRAIEARGSRVLLDHPVKELILEDGAVRGVRVDSGEFRTAETVVAVNAGAALKLLQPQLGGHPALESFFAMQTMPHVTLQLDLDEPLLPLDRTVFGPGTVLGSFTEQSRTTFRHVPGRVSVIMTPSDVLIGVPDEQLFEQACRDAERLGLDLRSHVTNYRVIRGRDCFYSVRPGNDRTRPAQQTDIPGLTLAGDYTRQPMYTTMEGAVLSGQLAAEAVLASSPAAAGLKR